ncbi:hypothetical protein FHG87_023710 [Trinorchestia longiramus]|nr:hypothetical protein FHG87_023710 [Trinorchestia longiramus]
MSQERSQDNDRMKRNKKKEGEKKREREKEREKERERERERRVAELCTKKDQLYVAEHSGIEHKRSAAFQYSIDQKKKPTLP